MSITGEFGAMPQRAGVAVTDLFTGLYATTAILQYICEINRARQHIDMALLDCAVSVMVNQAMNFMSTGISPKRLVISTLIFVLTKYLNVPMVTFRIIAVGNDKSVFGYVVF